MGARGFGLGERRMKGIFRRGLLVGGAYGTIGEFFTITIRKEKAGLSPCFPELRVSPRSIDFRQTSSRLAEEAAAISAPERDYPPKTQTAKKGKRLRCSGVIPIVWDYTIPRTASLFLWLAPYTAIFGLSSSREPLDKKIFGRSTKRRKDLVRETPRVE